MGVKITDLGPAALPLAGTEVFEIAVSEQESRKVSVDDLLTQVGGLDATFVTVTPNVDLPNERILTAGANINIVDNGAGNSIVISSVAAGGQVDSVVGGTNVTVDAGDPVNPIVNLDAALTGISVNGVTLDATGVATNFLDETGAYSVPAMASPGGANSNVQFNDSSVFGGEANFTWNELEKKLSIIHDAAPGSGRPALEITVEVAAPAVRFLTDQGVYSVFEINADAGVSVGFDLDANFSGADNAHFLNLTDQAGFSLQTWSRDGVVVLGGSTVSIDPVTNNSMRLGAAIVLEMQERSAAEAFTANIGQFWVRDTLDGEPMFTDALGVDTVLNGAASLTPWVSDIDGGGFNLDGAGVVFLVGQAVADADVSGQGQIWVEEGVAGDPLWAEVEMLADMDGSDGATAYTEVSDIGASATFFGTAELDTAQFNSGVSSLLLDGNSDWITFPDNAAYDLDANDWTIEGFVRFNTLPPLQTSLGPGFVLWDMRQGGSALVQYGIIQDGFGFRVRLVGADWGAEVGTISGGISTGIWYHWAVTRDSGDGNIRAYFNGNYEVADFGVSPGNIGGPDVPIIIGCRDSTDAFMDGWIDDVRFTNGTARYAGTGSYTPPSTPYLKAPGAVDLFFTDDLGGDFQLNAGSGGQVDSVVGGTNVTVDASDPVNPIVNLDAAITGVSVNGVTLSTAGAATDFLDETGAYSTPAGGGNVSNTGTPLVNQLAFWLNATTIQGDPDITWDGSTLDINLGDLLINNGEIFIHGSGGGDLWIFENADVESSRFTQVGDDLSISLSAAAGQINLNAGTGTGKVAVRNASFSITDSSLNDAVVMDRDLNDFTWVFGNSTRDWLVQGTLTGHIKFLHDLEMQAASMLILNDAVDSDQVTIQVESTTMAPSEALVFLGTGNIDVYSFDEPMNIDSGSYHVNGATEGLAFYRFGDSVSHSLRKDASGLHLQVVAGRLRLTADSIQMGEVASPATNAAGQGQIWVRSAAPCRPMFTDDTDVDQEMDPSRSDLNEQNGSYTFLITDKGKTVYKASGGAGETYTIPASGSVAYQIGTWIAIDNDGGGDLSIAITTDTLVGTDGVTGTRTLGDNERAVIQKIGATRWRYMASDI